MDCGKLADKGHLSKCEYDSAVDLQTTNNSLKNYFDTDNVAALVSKTPDEKSFSWDSVSMKWQQNNEGNFKVYFQVKEDNYQARSFEDGFFHINRQFLKEHKNEILGLKKSKLEEFVAVPSSISEYELAEKGIESKATFAVEIIYFSKQEAGNDFVGWTVPKYIKDGLLWIRK